MRLSIAVLFMGRLAFSSTARHTKPLPPKASNTCTSLSGSMPTRSATLSARYELSVFLVPGKIHPAPGLHHSLNHLIPSRDGRFIRDADKRMRERHVAQF